MKKKLIAISTVLISLVSAVSPLKALESPFPDVPGDSPYAAAIDFLKNKQIIAGYADKSFQPDKTINRAEALKLIFLARKELGIVDTLGSNQIKFPDVKAKDWFYDYVQKAVRLSIVKGYDDLTFKPANEITAAESFKIIEIGLIPGFESVTPLKAPFADVAVDRWYAPYVAYAKNKFLVEAKNDGNFAPERKLTRAEFAEVIYRVMYSQSNKLDKYPLNLNWKYCNNVESGYQIKYPYSWEIILAGKQLIFWRKDKINGQVSFARVYPNSAALVIAVDDNSGKLSLEKYLDLIDYGNDANKQLSTINGLPYATVKIEKNGLQDSFYKLGNGKIVAIYAQVGEGDLSFQLKEEIANIINSLKEADPNDLSGKECLLQTNTAKITETGMSFSAKELLTAELLKMILIKGKAEQALAQLSDEILIETDSIGIGTGPIDYYYSPSLNLSLKIDRNALTILATKTGKTSSF